MAFQLKILRKFCATGERGIDHEEAQSNKTAERLGLLKMEVQAFLFLPCEERDWSASLAVIRPGRLWPGESPAGKIR